MKKIIILSLLMTLSIAPNTAFASWWNPISWFKSAQPKENNNTKTEMLEKRIVELENKLNTVTSSSSPQISTATTTKSTKSSTTSSSTSVNKIYPTVKNKVKVTEKNYKDLLTTLYKNKIDYLTSMISYKTFSIAITKLKIDEVKSFVLASEELQYKYRQTNTVALNNISDKHTQFNKYQIERMQTIYSSTESNIEYFKIIKTKLETESNTLALRTSVTEVEYKMRVAELESLVNIEKLDKQTEEISSEIANLTKIDSKYDDLQIEIATKQKLDAESDLVLINSELEKLRSSAVQTPIVISPQQSKATSIQCETKQNVNGYPSTTCIELGTMKSMTCDTSYNTYGNATRNCYSN